MAVMPVTRTDPFDFPKSMVPIGLTYLWSSEKIMGETNPHHEKRLVEGWTPVPAQWHRPWFDGPDGPVRIQGNVLLCHAAAKDEEGERIAGAQRNLDNWQQKFGQFSGGVRIQRQSSDSVQAPQTVRLGDPALSRRIAPSAQSWAISQTAQDLPKLVDTIAPAPPPKSVIVRAPRHPAVAWLFNLISVEKSL